MSLADSTPLTETFFANSAFSSTLSFPSSSIITAPPKKQTAPCDNGWISRSPASVLMAFEPIFRLLPTDSELRTATSARVVEPETIKLSALVRNAESVERGVVLNNPKLSRTESFLSISDSSSSNLLKSRSELISSILLARIFSADKVPDNVALLDVRSWILDTRKAEFVADKESVSTFFALRSPAETLAAMTPEKAE